MHAVTLIWKVISNKKLFDCQNLLESCALNWSWNNQTINFDVLNYTLNWRNFDLWRKFNNHHGVILNKNCVLWNKRKSDHCFFLHSRIFCCSLDRHITSGWGESDSRFNLSNITSLIIIYLNLKRIGWSLVVILF